MGAGSADASCISSGKNAAFADGNYVFRKERNKTFAQAEIGFKNGEIESAGKIWQKYFDKIVESCNWFINASSPFIKRVHLPSLNEWMNSEREWCVRRAYLNMYERWLEALIRIHDNAHLHTPYTCVTEVRSMKGPDPYMGKLKPLKTFAGPCYKDNDPPMTLFLVTYEDNCQRTKVSIGTKFLSEGTTIPVPEFNLSFEKDYSPKFKEDDQFKLTAGVAVSKKIGILNEKEGNVSGKLEGEVSATVEDYWKFDSNGNLIAKGADASFEASIKGKSSFKDTEISDKSFDSKFGAGIKASYEVEVQCGQDSPPDRRVTTHLEKSLKSSAEVK